MTQINNVTRFTHNIVLLVLLNVFDTIFQISQSFTRIIPTEVNKEGTISSSVYRLC